MPKDKPIRVTLTGNDLHELKLMDYNLPAPAYRLPTLIVWKMKDIKAAEAVFHKCFYSFQGKARRVILDFE